MKPAIEVPLPSRAWLESLPMDAQVVAEGAFMDAVHEGITEPRLLCRRVTERLRELDAAAKATQDTKAQARLLRTWRHVIDQREGALSFALSCLESRAARGDDASPSYKQSPKWLASRLGVAAADWESEADFETALAFHFERAGCKVVRQPACNVTDYSGDKSKGLRRPDLHVTRPSGSDWPRTFSVELKLDKDTGHIRQGAKQAIAYVSAFDWREEGGRHSELRLPRPDMSFFTSPLILATSRFDQGSQDWFYLERDLWDNGCALLTWHRGGDSPGIYFRYIEKSHTLTGKRRWEP